ncbi:hypothetical protein FACS189452_08520 [Bacteroidia bacterium]|nr:hypothetical protein FACS189452_08520 [Bacteroidia bacterium]
MKKKQFLWGLAAATLLGAGAANAQTPVLTEDFEGDVSGWTLKTTGQTNKWYISGDDAAAVHDGFKAAYISNDEGATNAYTNNATSVVHLYRDVTLSTAASSHYKLTFWWKGEAESSYDDLQVFLIATSTTPTAGTQLNNPLGTYSSSSSWQQATLILPASAAAQRLVFSWRNDGSVGTNPPIAIDDIAISVVTVIPQKTVNLAAAGTLKDVADINLVQKLTLTGNIDARDVQFIRDEMIVLTELDLSGATVVAYDGSDGTNPSYTSYPVNEMPEYSFVDPDTYEGKTSPISVTLPTNLTSIGEGAFYECTGLTNITLPAGLITIGYSAFQNCSGLTGTLTLPVGLTSINNYTFSGCSGLTALTLPDGLIDIGNGAFSWCSGLTGTLSLPASLTTIYSAAFSNCSGLTALSLPVGLTTLDNNAFYGCNGLKHVINLNPSPLSISNVFSNATTSTALFAVPSAAVSTYAVATGWSDFSHIYGYDSVGTWVVYAAPNDYSLGSIGTAVAGNSITITPTPLGSNSFINWTSNGVQISTADPLVLNVTKDTVIVANFGIMGAVHLTVAGTLQDSSAKYDYTATTHLTITGEIDARDVKFIRDNLPVIMALDLSGASIVGLENSSDGTYPWGTRSYPANELPLYSFCGYSGGYTPKTSLTSVKLPSNLTGIGESAFNSCTGLTGTLNLPAGLTNIGYGAFSYCSGLTGLSLPVGLTTINDGAFSNCSGLTGALALPAGVTYIGDDAFGNCSGLTSLILPTSLTTIGSSAFQNCTGLTGTLTLPAGLTYIGDYAFYNGRFTSLILPTSLTTIGDGVFADCNQLTSITNLNPTPASITEWTFDGVDKTLCTLTVPSAAINLYKNADWWKLFLDVEGGGFSVVAKANSSLLGSVSSIDNRLYAANETLNLTATPNSGFQFLDWTAGGTSLGTSTALSHTVTTDVVIVANFRKAATVTLAAGERLKDKLSAAATVSHLTVIGEIDARDVQFMRDSMTVLVDLDLSGATVAAYSGTEGTFVGNNETYPAGEMPMLSFLDPDTGDGKTSLISVKLPTNLIGIGDYAFAMCTGLTSVPLPASVATIGESAFVQCTDLTSLTLPDNVAIGNYAFSNCSGLTALALPVGVTIGGSAFYNCSGLKSITFAEGITSISNSAFSDCTGLTSLNLPASLNTIEDWAFAYCDGLTGALTIPAGVTTIGEYAFYQCSNIASLSLPASLNTIGDYAFAYNYALTNIVNLRPTAVSITSDVFYNVNQGACTLSVLSSSDYASTAVWQNFNIVNGDYTFTLTAVNPSKGGVDGTANGFYASGTSIDLTAEPAQGYSFVNWTSNGTVLDAAAHLMFSLTQDTVLTANFAATQYTITYNADGGSGAANSNYTIEDATITLPAPTKAGYTFDGWYDNSSFTGNVVTFIAAGNTGNVAFWAKWTVIQYTITYNADGGSGATDSTYTIESATITLPTPTKTNYTFGGWYSNSGLTGSAVTTIATGSTGDKAFYAKWTATSATAVAAQSAQKLQVYPTIVTNGQLTIDNGQLSAGGKVEVYSLVGSLAGVYNVSGGASTTINIAHLPAGIYIVKVGNKAAKVVKQ